MVRRRSTARPSDSSLASDVWSKQDLVPHSRTSFVPPVTQNQSTATEGRVVFFMLVQSKSLACPFAGRFAAQ
jgi:hypothetical protein